MGQPLALDSLRFILGTDVFGTGKIAKDYMLRSLCVAIGSTCMGSFGTTASLYIIEEQLRALLKLKLNPRFVLTIRIVWDYRRYIDARRLQELAPVLKSVLRKFKQKGYETILEYQIHPCYAVDFHPNERAYKLTTYYNLRFEAHNFHAIRGTEAENMLSATSKRWYFYLSQQHIFRLCKIKF